MIVLPVYVGPKRSSVLHGSPFTSRAYRKHLCLTFGGGGPLSNSAVSHGVDESVSTSALYRSIRHVRQMIENGWRELLKLAGTSITKRSMLVVLGQGSLMITWVSKKMRTASRSRVGAQIARTVTGGSCSPPNIRHEWNYTPPTCKPDWTVLTSVERLVTCDIM